MSTDKKNFNAVKNGISEASGEFKIRKSFMKYRNVGDKNGEVVEIGIPYMIMYESISKAGNRANYFEFTEANSNYFFNDYDYIVQGGVRPLHYHEFYELTIVLSGELKMQIENEIRTYNPGDCCICNKNIRHKEITDNAEFEIVLFMLSEEYLKNLLSGDTVFDEQGNMFSNKTFFLELFKDNARHHFFDAKEYVEFRKKGDYVAEEYFELLNEMVLTIRENKAGKNYRMKADFCEFIEMLENKERFDISIKQSKLTSEDKIFITVGELLVANPTRISASFLEKQMGYNSDHINRVIKRRTGKTLSEFCRSYIIELAADRLLHTTESIGDICESLGYSNRSFFNKMFIREYGVTPSEYRRNKAGVMV